MVLVNTKSFENQQKPAKYGAQPIFNKLKGWGLKSLKIFDGNGFEEFVDSLV